MPYTNTTAENRPDLDIIVAEHIGVEQPGFVGTKLLPILPQEKSSGKFHKILFSEIDKQILDNRKTSTSGYNRIERTTDKDSFDCEKYGLEEPLDEDDVARMGMIEAEAMTSGLVSFNNLRAQEKRIAAKICTSTFGSAYQQAVVAAWCNAGTAKPLRDMNNSKNKLVKNIGGTKVPGCKLTLTITDEQLAALLETDEIMSKSLYTRKLGEGQPSLEELKAYFNVDDIFVASARIKKELIFSNAFGLLAIVSDSQGLKMIPRLGNTFLWTGSTASNNVTQTYRDEVKEADIVRVKHHVDEKIITAPCGVLLTGVLA